MFLRLLLSFKSVPGWILLNKSELIGNVMVIVVKSGLLGSGELGWGEILLSLIFTLFGEREGEEDDDEEDEYDADSDGEGEGEQGEYALL